MPRVPMQLALRYSSRTAASAILGTRLFSWHPVSGENPPKMDGPPGGVGIMSRLGPRTDLYDGPLLADFVAEVG